MYKKLEWNKQDDGSLQADSEYVPETDGERQSFVISETKDGFMLTGHFPEEEGVEPTESYTERKLETVQVRADIFNQQLYVSWLEEQAGKANILAKHEEQIRKQAAQCKDRLNDLNEAKEEVKSCKSMYEAACEELTRLASDKPTYGPLFEKNSKPVQPDPATEAWRKVSLQALVQHGAPKRSIDLMCDKAPPMDTIGKMSDYLAASEYNKLTDIDGIGQAGADKIVEAQAAWFAANPDMCPPIDDGADAKDEPEAEPEAEAEEEDLEAKASELETASSE